MRLGTGASPARRDRVNRMPMNKPEPIIEIGTIEVERAQVDLWKTGVLAPLWAQRFPELFREHDLDLARAQGHLGYHFIEWLGRDRAAPHDRLSLGR